MKTVEYKDPRGRLFAVTLPDHAKVSDAEMGIRVGPPPLDALKLPIALEVRLNNELYNRGLLTANDVRLNTAQVMWAWQAALGVDAQTIAALYE